MSEIQEIVLPSGEPVRLGCLPSPNPGRYCSTFSDERLVPRSEWDSLIDRLGDPWSHPCLPPIYNQNPVGQCNCEAATAALEFQRAAQGLPYVETSPADLYARINGGVDQGSTLDDALEEMRKRGVGTAAESGRRWLREEYRPAPDSSRRRYKFDEFQLCPTFDHLVSALLCGWAVVIGIRWYGGYKVDQDGWLTNPTGGYGGHAMMSFKPARRAGRYGLVTKNSWGTGWGRNGLLIVPESAFSRENWGCYAIRSVIDEGVM